MNVARANWIYLFHGEDDLSSREAVQGLVARMKESPVWECNVAFFEGEKLVPADLFTTCQTVPFLADKRLVVVTNLLARLSSSNAGTSREDASQERAPRGSKKALVEELAAFLPSVPDFCRLVFLEEQLVPERDPILKAILGLGGIVRVNRLEERGLIGWIRDRASKVGCRVSAEAAEELAVAVGPNARLLNGEMIKLATYCQERTIGAEDVRSLVSDARKANVFAMVDALGLRQPEVALREMRKLLGEGDHPLRIMGMVARQFRLLIQVKELTESGAGPDEIARAVGLPPRASASLQRQACNFSFEQLERAHRRLLDADFQLKTGVLEPDAALELLMLELLGMSTKSGEGEGPARAAF